MDVITLQESTVAVIKAVVYVTRIVKLVAAQLPRIINHGFEIQVTVVTEL